MLFWGGWAVANTTGRETRGHNPCITFWAKDWLGDTRILSPEEKGAWIDLISYMMMAQSGEITHTMEDFARMLGTTTENLKQIFHNLNEKGVTDFKVSRNGNENITVISRRLIREFNLRRHNAKRQRTFREKHSSNGDVTEKSRDDNSNVSGEPRFTTEPQDPQFPNSPDINIDSSIGGGGEPPPPENIKNNIKLEDRDSNHTLSVPLLPSSEDRGAVTAPAPRLIFTQCMKILKEINYPENNTGKQTLIECINSVPPLDPELICKDFVLYIKGKESHLKNFSTNNPFARLKAQFSNAWEIEKYRTRYMYKSGIKIVCPTCGEELEAKHLYKCECGKWICDECKGNPARNCIECARRKTEEWAKNIGEDDDNE